MPSISRHSRALGILHGNRHRTWQLGIVLGRAVILAKNESYRARNLAIHASKM